MKAVILAGGFGTRLAEMTEMIPKPMVTIGGHPILWHIMARYAHYGISDFIIALGYKASVVKEYFLKHYALNSDFQVDLASGQINYLSSSPGKWKVTLIDTGEKTMTGGRLARLKDQLSEDTFMVTYGDGVANIDISKLLEFHQAHGRTATITAVHPSARFGELEIDADSNIVRSFKEKPQLRQGWINGGFFVFERKFLDLIEGDETILEKQPLETVSELGDLMAYRHEGFWQCMDTMRDRTYLEELWGTGEAPWNAY